MTTQQPTALEKFQNLLRDLFLFDCADLGICRARQGDRSDKRRVRP